MKSIIILFDENNLYQDQKVFDGKSAKDLCISNFQNFDSELEIISGQKNVVELLEKISSVAENKNADAVVFSYSDCPFMNKVLFDELIKTHFEYKAEYTFVEGYPLSLSPEVISKSTIAILLKLAKETAQNIGNSKVSRNCIFDLIKTDINAFEIETVLAPVDWRLFRLSFNCAKKENFIACKNLYNLCKKNNYDVQKLYEINPVEISEKAVKELSIIKTVPSFYNLQLAQKCNGECSYCPYPKCYENKYGKKVYDAKDIMNYSDAEKLIENISQFSGQAVVGLSAWGECLNHPDLYKIIEKILSYDGLSVFMEIDGSSVTDDFCTKIKPIIENASERTNEWKKIMIAVSVDGFTEQTCKKLRGEKYNLQKTIENIKKLSQIIPDSVYPQFIRMNENESELESFFRYWKEKTNESSGNLIIQKYNSFAGLLKNEEPADLSPLERNVCWHLRRDMTILSNGDVPLCYCSVLDDIVGNVFEQGIETVWNAFNEEVQNQMNKKYCKKCGGCDEYYTFNF